MGNIFYFGWEEQYLVWLQHLGKNGVLHSVLLTLNNFFSFLGEETFCVAIMGLIYWGINKEKGRRIGIAVITANVCNGMIKNIFCRMRPYQSLDSIELLRDVDGYSFPSGHSANSAALYPSTAYEFKEKKWLKYFAICIPLLVAISRNFLGAHWPTDVIVGLLQGVLIFILVEFLSARCKNIYVVYGILLVSGFFGMFYCKTSDYFNSYGMLIGACLGTLFEENVVKFENTSKVSLVILRTIGGALTYLICNTVLKAVLGNLFEQDTTGYFLMRTLRYTILLFLLIGVYPMIFKAEQKFQKK